MSNIHVIAHTHWDQEWYFTLQDSNILASWNFADVIRTLEQNPAYTCYHFDGQTAVVEDFLAVNPQYCERLKQLVADRRLFIGHKKCLQLNNTIHINFHGTAAFVFYFAFNAHFILRINGEAAPIVVINFHGYRAAGILKLIALMAGFFNDMAFQHHFAVVWQGFGGGHSMYCHAGLHRSSAKSIGSGHTGQP